ncbi:MAG: TIGR03936 family radical SAM-associated protein [Candidatus Omnitrophica bacterium]|nr:TIGR03936 family radical SAM-associated protein [Candidatus Omnitrophota bacterium]
MQNEKFSVKLIIEKRGEMIYFSQLDLSLIINRALRRTTLPNYFTKGFRPHIKISFKDALKLGVAGEIEIILYFKENISSQEVIEKLNEELPEGLKVRSC